MKIEQVNQLWQQHSVKLDENTKISKQLLKACEHSKLASEVQKLKLFRVIEGLAFLFIAFNIWGYIVDDFAFTPLHISALIVNLFALIGLAGNIGQFALLCELNFSDPIKDTLKKLMAIRSHSLSVFKLMLMSVPFYLAYVLLGFDWFFDIDLYNKMPPTFLVIAAVSSLLLLPVVLWVNVRLKPKTHNTPIIKKLVSKVAGERLVRLIASVQALECEER